MPAGSEGSKNSPPSAPRRPRRACVCVRCGVRVCLSCKPSLPKPTPPTVCHSIQIWKQVFKKQHDAQWGRGGGRAVALGPQISESLIVRTWGGEGAAPAPTSPKCTDPRLGGATRGPGGASRGRAGPLGSVRTSLHRYLCLFIIGSSIFCLLLLLKVLTAFSLRSGLCVRPPSPLSFFFFFFCTFVCLFKKRKREKRILVTNCLGLSLSSQSTLPPAKIKITKR